MIIVMFRWMKQCLMPRGQWSSSMCQCSTTTSSINRGPCCTRMVCLLLLLSVLFLFGIIFLSFSLFFFSCFDMALGDLVGFAGDFFGPMSELSIICTASSQLEAKNLFYKSFIQVFIYLFYFILFYFGLF